MPINDNHNKDKILDMIFFKNTLQKEMTAMCRQRLTGSNHRAPVAPLSLPGKMQDDAPLPKSECISKECGVGSKPEKQTTNMDAPWTTDILGSVAAKF